MAEEKSPQSDWIDTPGLKHILEEEVPLAGELLALKEGRKHILVRGEPRTGKSHIRDKIREASGLKVIGKLNCTTFPDTLIDSIFFGIKKGASTGVDENLGLLTDKSPEPKVVLLEEIGELSPEIQAKLLVYLEKGEYHPIGGDWKDAGTSSLRIIATSNAENDKFRSDFLARFWKVTVPPIHERREDIPLFLNRFLDGDEKKLLPEEWFYLMTHNWPGGVSEIEEICIQIKHYFFSQKVTRRYNFVKELLNLKNYNHIRYFPYGAFSVTKHPLSFSDHKGEDKIAKLFPHLTLFSEDPHKSTPPYEYKAFIREWQAWCFFFDQDPKSSANIYDDMQNQKKYIPHFKNSFDFITNIDTHTYIRRNMTYFVDFIRREGLSKKEGAKFLNDLRDDVFNELFIQEEEEENAKTGQQVVSLEQTEEDLLKDYWSYHIEKKGRKGKDLVERTGVSKESISKTRKPKFVAKKKH